VSQVGRFGAAAIGRRAPRAVAHRRHETSLRQRRLVDNLSRQIGVRSWPNFRWLTAVRHWSPLGPSVECDESAQNRARQNPRSGNHLKSTTRPPSSTGVHSRAQATEPVRMCASPAPPGCRGLAVTDGRVRYARRLRPVPTRAASDCFFRRLGSWSTTGAVRDCPIR
jgi:hypothetical protein